MSTNYVYSGPDTQLGRFGTVVTGQILAIEASEIASLNENFFVKPTRGQLEKKVTISSDLTSEDVGKKIRCNHSAAITLTLPASPTAGDNFEVYFGDNASDDDVTLDPGSNGVPSGRIASYTVTNAGSAYSSIPTVAITDPSGNGAEATATVRMKVLTAPVAVAGSGYAIGDTIGLAGGTFTTRAVATVATAKVVSGSPSAAGTGYIIGEKITLTGGTAATAAKLQVATEKAVGVALAVAGTGYGANDVLTVVGGTGTATQITVDTVGGGGEVLTAHITTAGSYSVLPANPVAVTGGGGADATFNLTWGVLTVTVDTVGNYSVLPANPVAQGSSDGAGTGATFTVLWGVLTATVSTPGVYSVLPTNAVAQNTSSGSGTSATFNVTWGVVSVVAVVTGEGYSASPTVTFSGGGGTGAAASAVVTEVAGEIVLTAAEDSVGIYWNGEAWITY